MKLIKITILPTLLILTLVLSGCALFTKNNANTNTIIAQNENTNQAANTNTLNVNAVSDENTNINTGIDTSDWKTYTNEEYGFSFKYPSDWIYEIKKLFYPEEGNLNILFLSPVDQEIKNSINYTDQPVGIEVRVIESELSPIQYYQHQIGNLNIKYTEITLNNDLTGIAYNDPGISEGVYRNIFSNQQGILIDIRTFSINNIQNSLFIQFMNSFIFNS